MPTLQIRMTDEDHAMVAARGGIDYVRALIEQRVAEVDGALSLLLAAGWDRASIRQACGALDGAQHTHAVFGGGLWSGLGLAMQDATIDADGRVTGQATYRVALELHDAARIGRIEVDADRWGALLETTLRRSPVLVLALQCLARDYWSMAGRHPVVDAP